jgi:hypothetical protein
MKHKTKKIIIKTAEVDEEIVPIVKWLNSFEGIQTLYSCQGGNIDFESYISFVSDNYENIISVLETIRNIQNQNEKCFMRTEVDYNNSIFPLRYTIRWYDNKSMLDFCRFLRNKK